MGDLDVHADQSDKRKNEREVRIENTRQNPLARGHLEHFNRGAAKVERGDLIVDSTNLFAVVLFDDVLDVGNDRIDQVFLQRLFRGERLTLRDALFGKRCIAASPARVTSQVCRCVVDDLRFHDRVDLPARARNWMRRSCIRAGRRDRNVAGQKNEEPG